MNEKIINILRGGSRDAIKLVNGDAYDSTIDVFDDEKKQLLHLNHVSTIPSRLLFGIDQYNIHGILAPGTFCGIWNQNSKLGWHFTLFRREFLDKINSENELSENMMTFPSVKINPSMKNQMLISEVCIHTGGLVSNYSEGCQTIYKPDFTNFMKLFKDNEKVIVNLNAEPGYMYPPINSTGVDNLNSAIGNLAGQIKSNITGDIPADQKIKQLGDFLYAFQIEANEQTSGLSLGGGHS